MSALAKAADALRTAGARLRERSDEDVIEALGNVLRVWQDPEGRWQRSLVSTLPAAAGFSEPNVRDGLQRALRGWDAAALRELVDRELAGLHGDERFGAGLTSLVCGGAIPMPTLHQIVLSLVVRSPLLVKPASRDPVTASLVAASLAEIDGGDGGLGECLTVVPLDTSDDASMAAFLRSDSVVASGSDATIEAIRGRLDKTQRFVGYGHRFSLAAIGASALDIPTAEALATDISLWDQLGCMSPLAIYAVGCSAQQRIEFAATLARCLVIRELEAPLGEIDVASGAQVRQERDEARIRLAGVSAGRLFEGDDLRWTVVLEPDATPRPAPLHRFVRILPVSSPEELDACLALQRPHLSTVAVAGVDGALPSLQEVRVCPPGAMQTPPLGAPHDGRALLTTLLKIR